MRIAHCTASTLGAGLLLVSAAHAQVFSSSSYPYQDADCSGLKLTAAKGVPSGSVHKYAFHGPCKLLRSKVTTDKVAGIATGSSTSSVVEATVWVEAEAAWDKQSGLLSEEVKVEGAYAGTLSMLLKCAGDPVIYHVTCYQDAYDNETGWQGWDRAWLKARPITYGKTTPAQATAMSESGIAGNPPPPPPPPAPDEGKTPKPVALRDAAKAVAATNASASTVSTKSQPGPPDAEVRLNPQPEPPSAEVRPGFTTIPLKAGTRVALESRRVLAARREAQELRWAILDEKGVELRLFPAGSSALRSRTGDIVVDWGGGLYGAGRAAPARLQLPPSTRRARP